MPYGLTITGSISDTSVVLGQTVTLRIEATNPTGNGALQNTSTYPILVSSPNFPYKVPSGTTVLNGAGQEVSFSYALPQTTIPDLVFRPLFKGDTNQDGVRDVGETWIVTGDTNGNGIVDGTEVWSTSAVDNFKYVHQQDTNNNGRLDGGETWVWLADLNITQAIVSSAGQIDGRDNYSVDIFGNPIADDINGLPGADGIADLDNVLEFDIRVFARGVTSPLSNTADITSLIGNATITIEPAPQLVVTKTADTSVVYHAGDTINYTVTVANTGNEALTSLSLNDPLLGTALQADLAASGVNAGLNIGDTDGDGVLDIGETWTYKGAYSVTAGDISANGGSDHAGYSGNIGDSYIDNTATATAYYGTQAITGSSSVAVEIINPHLTVTKTADKAFVENVNDQILWTVSVTNDGNKALTSLSVSDPLLGTALQPVLSGSFNLGDTDADGVLDVGETWTYQGTYALTANDISTNGGGDGDIDNSANAIAYDGTVAVTDAGSAEVPILRPHMTVTKTADVTSVQGASDQIVYTVTVLNDDTVPLYSLSLNDPLLGSGLQAVVQSSGYIGKNIGDTDGDGVLDAQETWIYQGTYSVNAADISTNGGADHAGYSGAGGDGYVDNTVVATASYSGIQISASASQAVEIIRPHLTVAKTAQETAVYAASDLVHWTVSVTNDGNKALTSVSVDDPLLGTGGLQAVVQTVGYSGANIGDTDGDGVLDVGETWTYTGTYTVQGADISANGGSDHTGYTGSGGDGYIDNTVDVTASYGTIGVSGSASAAVEIINPHLTVAKSADKSFVSAVSDQIVWTVTVTNDGNKALTSVSVDDPLLGTGGLQAVVQTVGYSGANIGDTDGDGVLDVGETWTYTGTYTVQGADISANGGSDHTGYTGSGGDGYIDNTVDVTASYGTIGVSGSASAAVEIVNPHMTVTKSANVSVVHSDGDQVLYTVLVKNDGTKALTNLNVSDPLLGNSLQASTGQGTLYNVGDANANDVLDVGETWTYTGTYVVSQEDLDNWGAADGNSDGRLLNTVAATAAYGSDLYVSDTDSASVSIAAAPSLSVAKAADISSFNLGDTIHYTIDVANEGNVSLSNIRVSDPLPGVTLVEGYQGDVNHDGVMDAGETWVHVGDTNGDGVLDAGEAWQYLDASGGVQTLDSAAGVSAVAGTWLYANEGDADHDNLLDTSETWTWYASYTPQSNTTVRNTATAWGDYAPMGQSGTVQASGSETVYPASNPIDPQGLSHGYWKNHLTDWDGDGVDQNGNPIAITTDTTGGNGKGNGNGSKGLDLATESYFEKFFGIEDSSNSLNWAVKASGGGGSSKLTSSSKQDVTLLEALQAKGGGQYALARDAVAAVLNARDEDVSSGQVVNGKIKTYMFEESDIKSWVHDALTGKAIDIPASDHFGALHFAAGDSAITGLQQILNYYNTLELH